MTAMTAFDVVLFRVRTLLKDWAQQHRETWEGPLLCSGGGKSLWLKSCTIVIGSSVCDILFENVFSYFKWGLRALGK
jgi:hypothetical protein